MISARELNPHGYVPSPEVAANLAELLDKINQVRSAYGKPMVVTSGLRSDGDQARINPSARHSKHISGQACDILDEDGALKTWVLLNIELMEKIGFWFEAFDSTPNWVHFQVVAPGSGKRFFIP